MGLEIERKFLVDGDSWHDHVVSSKIMRQGYISSSNNTSLRVRISGDKAHLNIKSGGLSITRLEYEYEIPVEDGMEMLRELTSGALVEKTRYKVRCDEHLWDLDVFMGDNGGLIVAEVELEDESEPFRIPEWAGKEVSTDARYYNINLIDNPYSNWKDEL